MQKKQLNLLLSFPKGMAPSPEKQELIKNVSRRIHLFDASSLINLETTGDFSLRDKLDEQLAGAEVFFGAPPPADLIRRSPNLKWIHSPLAGVEPFLRQDIISSDVLLTKASIHAEQIGEAVFNMMLMLARRSQDYFLQQQQRQWKRVNPAILRSKTLGIIGLGNIGLGVAHLARAFGMKVIATKTHPEGKYKNVDRVLPASQLITLLSESDFVVLLVPLTSMTRNLIGEKEFRAMKPTSYLINVSRGGVVDEDVLVKALNENWIAGAAADVFACEPSPLPPQDHLWTAPNLIITPHIAGMREDYHDLLIGQFIINLRRYISGRPLLNPVDKRLGY
jgi:phosphoglycerate dehydrogenase-like enzyme